MHPNVAIPSTPSTTSTAFAAASSSSYFVDFLQNIGSFGGSIGAASGNSVAPGSLTGLDENHPGNVQLISGTGGSGTGEYFYLGTTYNAYNLDRVPAWAVSTNFYISTLTSARYVCGFLNTIAANPVTDGFYMVYDSSVGTKWLGITVSSSTATTVDTGVAAAATTWTSLGMSMDGTTVTFYVNGVAKGKSTTNLKSGALRWAWQAIGLSASSVNAVTDYFSWSRAVTR